ncbi:MAG TPA: NAD(P)/FAD-dependent oxidoreductase [Gemmatimonadaceae bacterium]|nr:NAD(P)/FAD-dependent oxidoreductase [Gemmatimonadaceae bacterium]
MMQLDSLRVIVVGGAIGGCTTALLLARAGARVTLIERVAQPRAVGAGIAIAANGQAVLDGLGLGPALAAAPLVQNGRVADGRGRVLLEPMAAMPPMRMLRRATLAAVLLDAIAAEPRITAMFGAEVLAATAEGSLRARTPLGETDLSADLVVAADGAHSALRASLPFGARVRTNGIPYLRALLPEGLALEEEAWTAAGLFGSFAVDGATYIYASAGTAPLRAAVAARDLDAFREAWRLAYPAAGPLLAPLARWDELLLNTVVRVQCARWSVGRVTLLGDAAHAMAPNLGQGANSAMVDAAVLLHALRQEADVPAALAAYERRRRPAVERVAQTSARLGALADRTSGLARFARDRLLMPLLRVLPASGAVRMTLQEDPELLRQICVAS